MGLMDFSGGGIIEAGVDVYNAKQDRKQAKKSAREQMRFQERMSNTAYQRAAKDLEAAGLNRILALGNAASTPSGASYSQDTPSIQGVFERDAKTVTERKTRDPRVRVLETTAQQQESSAKSADATARATNYEVDVLGPKKVEELDSKIKANNANSARTAVETSMLEQGRVGKEFGQNIGKVYDSVTKDAPSIINSIEKALNQADTSARQHGARTRDKAKELIRKFGKEWDTIKEYWQ